MIERAHRVVVVCDASKIGRSALAVICQPTDVDELITDGTADARCSTSCAPPACP